MKINQKMLLIMTILLASLAVSAALRTGRQASPPAEETTTAAPAPYAYLLRCESRRAESQNLELFCVSQGEGTNDVLEKIADFHVTLDDLPEIDRQWLQTGIALRNAEELQRTLEDYLPAW